ncbi:sialoadhesin-like [Leuresthes tenuis]|uniref:sialoadhesin-like n=1 Tax=Leuresthes tenuis TaxID=355514 RepID=UPI003B508415
MTVQLLWEQVQSSHAQCSEKEQAGYLEIDSAQAAASVKVSPDSVQHFSGETISLSCEGKSPEWRVMRLTENNYASNCSAWGTMTGSTCIIRNTTMKTAVYWCESGSGFSNAVNISSPSKDIILVSPVQPVTKGEAVTLVCRLRNRVCVSNVFFYRNDSVIQNHSKSELKIHAVSESDEGFYKCECSGKVSTTSWMSVKSAPRHESSSFHGQLIIGLVCGFLLISGFVLILLLLFCHQTRSKDQLYNVTHFKPKSTGEKEDNLLYAEIHFNSRDAHNDDEGNTSPEDIAETVYSEVKQ